MSRPQFIRLLISLALLVLFVLHAFNIIELPALKKLENFAYDTQVRLSLKGNTDKRIVIIDLDEKSLAKIGRWPWGRHQLAKLTETLFDHYRILVLGFDVVFSEQDESSGLPVLDRLASGLLKDQPGFLLSLNKLRPSLERDARFARTLRGRHVLLGYYFKSKVDPKFAVSGALPDPVISLQELGRSNIPFVKAAGFGANLPILQSAAQNGGFFDNPLLESDGVNRRIPLLQEYQGKLYQSLSLGLVRTILGDPPVTMGITPVAKNPKDIETGLEWVGLGPHHIPVDERASILIPYRGRPGSFPYISASDVLDQTANSDLLNDAIVLVGSTAPGLMDLRVTPIQNAFPGVEIHANIISGILDASIKRRPSHSLVFELFYYFLIALAMILLMTRLTPIWGFYLTLLILLLIVWSHLFFWRRVDILIPIASPVVLTLLLFMLNNIFEILIHSRSKSHISSLFGHYLPQEQVEAIHSSGKTIETKGERRDMTVMFVNIQDFTTIAEQRKPEELTHIMNTYLTKMTTVIHENQGAIDKYMGDVIMAYWGAPLENSRHARNAMKAAMRMIESLNQQEDEFRTQGWPEFSIGIGLNSGSVNVGIMGSDFRKAYTVWGATVKQALKLESCTKQYGATIIAGAETRKNLPEVIFRELDRIRIQGKSLPVSIFEPVGFVDEVSGDTRTEVDAYHKALALYRGRRWKEAQHRFHLLHQRDPERLIYEVYLSRIQHFMQHPPDSDWDGVFPKGL
ncbi:MAG: adenylate/guanylate cyclase domain-containing protein [Magnetococcales bacterium]|nr:adenylate/guanylate cyclase domain-containing protein [Magnetococcales bacterium]